MSSPDATGETKRFDEEDTMHPLLAGDLARQRIDAYRQRAEQRQLAGNRRRRGAGAAVRIAAGSRLIALGCRLFLSGHRESGGVVPSG